MVHPGLEALAAAATEVIDGAGGGAFSVYWRGELVIDIWGGRRVPSSAAPWEHDSMAMAWSTTKGITSTVLHMLVAFVPDSEFPPVTTAVLVVDEQQGGVHLVVEPLGSERDLEAEDYADLLVRLATA